MPLTEQEYIDRIADLWPGPDEDSSWDLILLAEEAVQAFPQSPELWWYLGFALCRIDPDSRPLTIRRLDCLRRVVELDRGHADAHEEIGYLLDTYFDDFHGAEEAFRDAIASGAGVDSYVGLARVLAQMGRREEALSLLATLSSPDATHPSVINMTNELNEGIWEPRP